MLSPGAVEVHARPRPDNVTYALATFSFSRSFALGAAFSTEKWPVYAILSFILFLPPAPAGLRGGELRDGNWSDPRAPAFLRGPRQQYHRAARRPGLPPLPRAESQCSDGELMLCLFFLFWYTLSSETRINIVL